MTDEAKALVERLRWGAWYYEDPFDGKAYASDDPLEAADLIETQAREIERLRKELRDIIAHSQKHIDDTDAYTMSQHKIRAARAALGGE